MITVRETGAGAIAGYPGGFPVDDDAHGGDGLSDPRYDTPRRPGPWTLPGMI